MIVIAPATRQARLPLVAGELGMSNHPGVFRQRLRGPEPHWMSKRREAAKRAPDISYDEMKPLSEPSDLPSENISTDTVKPIEM